MTIERWTDAAQVPAITRLLHAAYRPLADAGMRYYASHQSDEDTLARLSKGEAYIALDGSEIIGTIALSPPGSLGHHCELYGRPDVCVFHQFAVAIDRQRAGIGSRLLEECERRTRDLGATHLACDTAEIADHLIAMYQKRGFEHAGYADWEVTNYRSVLLLKAL